MTFLIYLIYFNNYDFILRQKIYSSNKGGESVRLFSLLSRFRNRALSGIEEAAKDPDSKRLVKNLEKKAKDLGVHIYKDPYFDNSAYTGTALGKLIRSTKRKAQKLRKEGKTEAADKLDKIYDAVGDIVSNPSGSTKLKKVLGKDAIIMGLGDNDPAVLAHELGHAHHEFDGKKRSKNIVAKLAQSGLVNLNAISTLGAGANGIIGGYKAAEDKDRGDKKKSKKRLLRQMGLTTALQLPTLISEGSASIKGMKLLKEAGANKEQLKRSRKTLGNAFGTYASRAAKPIIEKAAGLAVGEGLYKVTHRKISIYFYDFLNHNV